MTPLMLLDAGLRGAVLAWLLLAAGVVLVRRLRGPATKVAVAMALGLAVQVVASAPWVEAQLPRLWQAPLVGVSVANAVLFWIFASTLFIDGFRPRAPHAFAWLAAAVLGLLNCAVLAGSGHPWAPYTLAAQRLVAPVFAVLAAWAALLHWRADLVEWRRRLRVFLVATGTAYTLVQVGLRMASPDGRLHGMAALADVLVLLVIAAAAAVDQVVSWSTTARTEPGFAGEGRAAPDAVERLPEDGAPGSALAIPPTTTATGGDGGSSADPAQDRLAQALEEAMVQQRVYRSEDLTITSLAARLAVPEYRLRRLINQRLGHRNFNAFVNGYRLAEARTALADPARAHLPILSIALEAGFQSIGPFNRAFKADTGRTPSEFRAQHIADSGIGQPQVLA